MFEWDEAKRDANLVKHGVDFVDALEVFADPRRIERIDKRRGYREERRQVVGRVGEQVLSLCVHAARRGTTRDFRTEVSKDERRTYLESCARR